MPTPNMFVVFKQGVYRHEGGGVYSTAPLAIAAAKTLAAVERDQYHTFVVVPFQLNVIPTPRPDNDPHSIVQFAEHFPIFTCRHGDFPQ